MMVFESQNLFQTEVRDVKIYHKVLLELAISLFYVYERIYTERLRNFVHLHQSGIY